ncbi:MAG: TIGR03013 family XrtA/PEP-CTERM system glycosyltransferase [Halieaceae bacterium]|nr:TIGR03013 family XrtA/PEP-CTERM system glycosyltransferase [Halieaceae bacterium]
MTGLAGTVRIFNHHVNVGYYWLALIDMLLFGASMWAGTALYFSYSDEILTTSAPALPLQAVIFAVVTTIAMFSMGLYEPKLREGLNGILLRTAGAFGLMTLAMALVFYVMPGLHIWRGNFVLSGAVAFAAALTNRLLWTRFISLEQFKRRVLVLGAGETAATINRKMRRQSDRRGFRILGYVRQVGEQSLIEQEPTIALDSSICEYAQRNGITDIIVALEDRRDHLPQRELMRCSAMGVRVHDIVDFFEQEAGKVVIRHVHPSWFTTSKGFDAQNADRFSKRLFDVSMAFILFVFTSPLMLLTVLAIWLEDGFGAPVLYRQSRVGLNGRVFKVNKFRSMTVNAESDGKARWATANDSRVTRVGRFIRKTRIDELPQIINVMAGEMAFVGPRPERPEFVRELQEQIPYFDKRHCVKPGITGWAQMNYPYGASLKDSFNKLEFDLYYVKNQSLFLDFLVLLQTAEVIIFGKGAR